MSPAQQAGPVRVLVATPTGSEGQGGIDRLYFYLRQVIAQRGLDGVDIRYFAARGPAEGRRSMLAFPARMLRFAWVLATGGIDIVHLNHSTHGSVYRKAVLALVAAIFGKRIVIHFHGMVTPKDQAAQPFWYKLLGWMARDADRVVVLGRAFAPFFSRTLGAAPERIAVIPNGIPDFAPGIVTPKAPDGEPPLILFAGEVGLRKGADLLLDALAKLETMTPDWRCVMAGNGEVDVFRSHAAGLGLEHKVAFTGWVDSAAVHALMREAAIVVLPSRVEGLPLTLLEGACAGTALVASDVGAITDIVDDGVTGAIVALEPQHIAARLAELLLSPDRLGRAQVEARRAFEQHYEIGRFADHLRGLYLEIAAR